MQNNKFLKIILFVLGLAVLLVFVLYYFVYEDIKSKNQHVSTLSNDLSSQSAKRDYLILTQKVIQNIGIDINRINNSIIAKDGDVKFIENLESIARQNGLTMTIDSLVLADNPEFASSSITTLQIRAKTKGNWSGNYKFLVELESLPIKIRVNKFDLSNTAVETGSDVKKAGVGIWQSTFEISVLKYK